MSFKVTLSGFETMEQAKLFLNWFEGHGEQDEGIGMFMESSGVSFVNCDVQTGMIEHVDGVEYKVKIFYAK